MDQSDLSQLLSSLIATWENEVIEFKEAGNDYKTDKIGEYFSALSNEANLQGRDCGWLVFGVNNYSRQVMGSNYREDSERLQSLKHQIAQGTAPSVSFRDIHVLHHDHGRVVLLEIPAAPQGIPIAWKGHYYARAGESVMPLGLTKLDEIRQQTLEQDWSAQLVPDAALEDLDPQAIEKAREAFCRKHANRLSSEEVAAWSLASFLDRARITRNGQITRTALLLLGKPESAVLLSPHPAQLTWKLEGSERAYEHFVTPFLLTTTQLYQRIRNIQLRLLPQDQLVPVEVSKYDQKIILEALHNCIAHQDYRCSARITVIEQPDRLLFENEGAFFDGTPDDYLEGTRVPRRYRNPFLCQAMAELNMIDTMGFGIHDMHARQAKRYFPMPDYDLHEAGVVRLTIYGGVVDTAYSRLLLQKTDLPLADVLALDRVQKNFPIPDDAAKRLKRSKLIEGRKPKYFVSSSIAKATGSKADYIRTRAQDDAFYIKSVTDLLKKFGSASREDIDKLLLDKLSDALTPEQKQRKVGNLLTKMRRKNLIVNTGSRAHPIWKLAE